MSVFTKTIMKIIPLMTMLACSLVVEAQETVKEDKKIDVKCFVELVGGEQIISFWNIPTSKVSSLSKSITGHKIMVPGSKQKVKIYKTHECVLSNDDYTGSRAKIVDSETGR